MLEQSEMKRCFVCGPQPVGAFEVKRNGKLHSYCRPCHLKKNRECYAKRLKKLPPGEAVRRLEAEAPGLFPPAAAGESIGCLRCRHAQVSLETEFRPGNSAPLIFCERLEWEGKNPIRPICWVNCPMADPRQAQPKALRIYWNRWGPLGDRIRCATPLMIAFLKAHWQTLTSENLVAATGWDMRRIEAVVRYHGIGGVRVGKTRLHLCGMVNHRFTRAQSDLIGDLYNTEKWPGVITYNINPEERRRREALRRAIVRQVRALNPEGPKWTFPQIQRHNTKRLHSDLARRKKARSGIKRKVNQHMSVNY
jgi:hypothetical protein